VRDSLTETLARSAKEYIRPNYDGRLSQLPIVHGPSTFRTERGASGGTKGLSRLGGCEGGEVGFLECDEAGAEVE
jgi:hypothetical protein